jgi:prophage regulatory protein
MAIGRQAAHGGVSSHGNGGREGGEGPEAYRLLHTAEVLHILGISRTGPYLWRKAGVFPAARRLGPNSIGWLWSDIKAFLESRPPA